MQRVLLTIFAFSTAVAGFLAADYRSQLMESYAKIAALKTERDAAVERWMQQEQDFHRRVLDAATKTLNPDQIDALRKGFEQTTEMQKFGLKMSREMFKGGGTVQGATIQIAPAPR